MVLGLRNTQRLQDAALVSPGPVFAGHGGGLGRGIPRCIAAIQGAAVVGFEGTFPRVWFCSGERRSQTLGWGARGVSETLQVGRMALNLAALGRNNLREKRSEGCDGDTVSGRKGGRGEGEAEEWAGGCAPRGEGLADYVQLQGV